MPSAARRRSKSATYKLSRLARTNAAGGNRNLRGCTPGASADTPRPQSPAEAGLSAWWRTSRLSDVASVLELILHRYSPRRRYRVRGVSPPADRSFAPPGLAVTIDEPSLQVSLPVLRCLRIGRTRPTLCAHIENVVFRAKSLNKIFDVRGCALASIKAGDSRYPEYFLSGIASPSGQDDASGDWPP